MCPRCLFLFFPFHQSIVLQWANEFGLPLESTKSGPPTIYGKNFALVGLSNKTSSSEIIYRESQHTFKCYASGRRYVNGMLTTLELCKRQDLLSRVVGLVMPQSDRLVVEVDMSEGSMPPLVLAVVKKKSSKDFVTSHKDVRKFAKVVSDPQQALSSKAQQNFVWPKKKLVVLSESKDLFTDLVTETAMRNVFDSKTFLAKYDKYFESMYFTTEGALNGGEGVPAPFATRLLRFEFRLPKDVKKMGELEALVELIFHLVDCVGAHKLSGDRLKKAQQKRKELEEELFKATLQQRQEAAARKREEKFEKEKAGMTPAQAAKAEEKRMNKLKKKQRPKMKMMK